MRRLIYAVALAALGLILSGCAATSAEQQVPLGAASFHTLAEGASLGQSFVVHHDGLVGVEVYLRPATGGDGELVAQLLAGRGGPAVATARLPASQVTGAGMYALRFDAPLQSRQRDYYLLLELRGAGSVEAAAMPGSSYRDGALYVGGQPVDGQLVHGHLFAAGPRLLGFLARLASLAVPLLGFLAAFGLPGLALLAAAGYDHSGRSWVEQLTTAVGVGVASLPLLLVWAQLAGVRPGPLAVWLPALAGAAVLGRRVWRRVAAGTPWRPRLDWLDLGLIGLIGLIVGVRLVVVGSLEAPMWGDSVQHTVMAQLILDNGGLFSSWQPYAPYESLSVQFGFSAAAAGLAWVTGMGSVEATILTGQLLNAAATIGLYPLALRLSGGQRWAGLATVIVAGLVSILPGFYVNWGRYAQLSGQAALPAAMLLTWDLLEARGRQWRQGVLVGLVVAGMSLCHYRMAFFYTFFFAVMLPCWGLPRLGRDWRAWAGVAGRLGLAGLCTLLFFMPWALQVASSQLAEVMVLATVQGTPLEWVLTSYRAWDMLPVYVPLPLQAVWIWALIWAAYRRSWPVFGLGVWALLLAGYLATSLFNVPGAAMLESFAVLIALYMPISLAVGWLAGDLIGALSRRSARAGALAGALALAALAGWGGIQQLRVVDPKHIMVTRPDSKAMGWIAANTPADARFLIHGFMVFGDTSIVGADAGWWIPVLARRANTIPPQYAITNERPDPPEYSRQVIELVRELRDSSPAAPEGMRLLCAAGVTHVYNGQGQGAVAAIPDPLFNPDDLLRSPYFTLSYSEDRVRIFSFDRSVCANS